MRILMITLIACLVVSPATAFANGGHYGSVRGLLAGGMGHCAVAPARYPGCADAGSELGMISIQSLMSQRQQAIQLTTQILGATQCQKCIDNIGR